MQKQEPRPAYHRRNDLKRLQELVDHSMAPFRVSDEQSSYVLRTEHGEVAIKGRYQIVYTYLCGWRDAVAWNLLE